MKPGKFQSLLLERRVLNFSLKLIAKGYEFDFLLYYLLRGLEFTVRTSHMGAFLEQLQSEQLNKATEKESGLHLYSNDAAM